MALLTEFPEDAVRCIPNDFARSWFAVSTLSNHEKKAELHLSMREIESFLPLYTVSKQWKNRVTAKVSLPLFAGYLFVRIAPAQRSTVLATPLVRGLVGNGRESLALADTEIAALRDGLRDRQVDPHPYLKVGELARIRSGALAGMQGVVVRKDSQCRIVLSIHLIQRSVAVHVSSDELEPCSLTA
jgi:transcription antitermination factor NusG